MCLKVGEAYIGFVCTCMYIHVHIHTSLLRNLFGSSEIPEKLHSFQVESNHTAVCGSEIFVRSLSLSVSSSLFGQICCWCFVRHPLGVRSCELTVPTGTQQLVAQTGFFPPLPALSRASGDDQETPMCVLKHTASLTQLEQPNRLWG